jgi:hypothetical protein
MAFARWLVVSSRPGCQAFKGIRQATFLQLKFCKIGLQNPLKDVSRNFAMQTP